MDSQFFEKYSPLLKQYGLPLGLGLVGLICLGIGLIIYFSQPSDSSEILFETSQNSPKEEVSLSKIVVDIEGAVEKPGVYELSESSRVKDLLVLAGGLSKDANRDWIAKNLNLAMRLSDSAKLYIPYDFEQDSYSNTSVSALGSQSSLININSASMSQLDSLSGVGAVTAQKIIDARPFVSLEELTSKKIVSSSVFEKIKDRLTLY